MLGHNRLTRIRSTRRWWMVCLTLGVLLTAGCSRQHFRDRADKDVEGLISQKNINPAWKVENWHAYPDSRARFADPSCPDFPPYPPDDYYTWLTSPNPQRPGRGGAGRHEGTGYIQQIAAWDTQNRAEDAVTDQQTPQIPMPTDDKAKKDDASTAPIGALAGSALAAYKNVFNADQPAFRIRLDQAVELAIFNSREFQDRREDLYLAALPVSLERYGFAAQAFAAEQIIRQSTGRDFPGGASEQWRLNTSSGNGTGFNRAFATGGTLLVRLANQIVIDLSGDKPQTSISNLGLTLIQPLLRGGGLAVTLESLTNVERTLLYAIRSYARFRKIFYSTLAGTANYTNNPYGLQGLSVNLGRGVGTNFTAQQTGFLPTVLRGATLANERKNVTALEQFLLLFENLKEGGGVNELQVVRVEQNLLRSRNTVLTSTRLYLDNIDFFKLQLGVPATMPIELDDTPLRPMRQQVGKFEEVYQQLRDIEVAAGQFVAGERAAMLRERWAKLLTDSPLSRGTPFAKDYLKFAGELRRQLDEPLAKQLLALAETRRKMLDARADRQLKNKPETLESFAELDAVESAIDRIRFEQALRRYELQPWLRVAADRQAAEQASWFRSVFEAGMLVAIQPRSQRLDKIRDNWPVLPPVVIDGVDLVQVSLDEAQGKVAQTALVNRLDLMNARAQVVDAWRQIAVRANALQGTFDVRYDLLSTTPRDEAAGLAFAGTRTQHTVTLRVEPPFVRRAERNQYRAALIGYQRQRRNLQAFEDNIITDSRQDLRAIRQLAQTYALQQRAIELAYAQVDNARGSFVAPPDPQVRETAGNIAALTQQLLDAQSSLLQAQNDLYTTWINYITSRMELYLDLELLPLDARGIWTDDSSPQPNDDRRRDSGPLPGPTGGERAPEPKLVPPDNAGGGPGR